MTRDKTKGDDMSEKKPIVLIVDDQITNLQLLLHFLQLHGFETHIAENGERALRVLDHLKPDLILLDVMMPGMDGFETCKQIKLQPELANIPIIFMTAMASLEHKIEGFEAGGADYITKPFDQDEALLRINTHITLYRQQQQLEQMLAKKRALAGILRICPSCKRIRNSEGYWLQVERYLAEHSEALFRHGICPNCQGKTL